MDIKLIKNLINLFESSRLTELEVSEGEGEKAFSLKLGKGVNASEHAAAPAPIPAAAEGAAPPLSGGVMSEGVLDYNKVEDIKSPMVGVFYAQSSPDAPPFVKKGDSVKKGDTLCIIEAMKLMNEVVAERDGEIVEVCVDNGSLVEFGQVLFRIY